MGTTLLRSKNAESLTTSCVYPEGLHVILFRNEMIVLLYLDAVVLPRELSSLGLSLGSSHGRSQRTHHSKQRSCCRRQLHQPLTDTSAWNNATHPVHDDNLSCQQIALTTSTAATHQIGPSLQSPMGRAKATGENTRSPKIDNGYLKTTCSHITGLGVGYSHRV